MDGPQDDKPIEVFDSAAPAQLGAGTRDLLLLVGALPALLLVLGKRDVVQLVNWLASEPGLLFVGAAMSIITPIWRQWKARREHAKTVRLVGKVPDTEARIVSTPLVGKGDR